VGGWVGGWVSACRLITRTLGHVLDHHHGPVVTGLQGHSLCSHEGHLATELARITVHLKHLPGGDARGGGPQTQGAATRARASLTNSEAHTGDPRVTQSHGHTPHASTHTNTRMQTHGCTHMSSSSSTATQRGSGTVTQQQNQQLQHQAATQAPTSSAVLRAAFTTSRLSVNDFTRLQFSSTVESSQLPTQHEHTHEHAVMSFGAHSIASGDHGAAPPPGHTAPPTAPPTPHPTLHTARKHSTAKNRDDRGERGGAVGGATA
jgi:hypothetical protein